MNTTPKRRNAAATRERLLNAAREVFTEKGYAGAGLREICNRAGVDQALISRYFGSKQNLFAAVFETADGIQRLLQGPRATLGYRLADYFTSKHQRDSGFDATIALLKSIGSETVNQYSKDMLERQFIDLLAAHIGGQKSKQRAAIIIAQLMGFDVLKRVLGVDALSPRHRTTIISLWGKQIQQLVDG